MRLPGWLGRGIQWVIRPLYGGRSIDAVTIGHTIVYLSEPTPELERHEFQHVLQAIRYQPAWWPWWLGRRYVGVLLFWGAYLIEYARHGYHDNRFEIEARRVAGQEEP